LEWAEVVSRHEPETRGGRAARRDQDQPEQHLRFNAIGEAGGTLLAVGALVKAPMLLMKRTGTTWKNLPVPSAAGDLESIAVTGSKSAWTAGVILNTKSNPIGDVLLRWNGNSWKSQSFPLHGANENLWGLGAGPGGAVWAVGGSHNNAGTAFTPLSMVWNGSSWRKVAVPAPANSTLTGVTFIPGGTAWATGNSGDGVHTLILHWTGTAWKQVASPSPGYLNYASAVSALSASNAWAVGVKAVDVSGTGVWRTLILHWDGRAWH
jgi:hypothetical protein